MRDHSAPSLPVTVVGIGADGWDGLGVQARAAVLSAELVAGATRHLAMIPDCPAERHPWSGNPRVLLPALMAHGGDKRLCVLASGDPMFYGIGTALAELLGSERLRVFPQPSSASLACARLGWPLQEVSVVSVVGRPLETVMPALVSGARVLVLSANGDTPAELAKLLVDNGFSTTKLVVMAQLGGPNETVSAGEALGWSMPPGDPLNVVAFTCRADPGTLRLTRLPGLPDEVFGGTGQFTKAEIRAVTMAALAPAPGECLWDVGAGSGSIAVEWCRTDSRCWAVAYEDNSERVARIEANALRLGVSRIKIHGRAPEEFVSDVPDAIFVGGGVSTDGLLAACWRRLRPGGRMAVNAVTLEGEAALINWTREHGGSLRRLQVSHAESIGQVTMWQPKRAITQWYGQSPHIG